MATRRNRRCIYCERPAGSNEHTVLAGLGGLRTDRGILCQSCNNTLGGTLDARLVEGLAPLNAMAGVRHGRTGIPIPTFVREPKTGAEYLLAEGGKLSHATAVVSREERRGGTLLVQTLSSTQKQADDDVRRRRAEGKTVRILSRSTSRRMFVGPLFVEASFGGEEHFRAVARAALNVFAHFEPEMARQPWLDPLKEFILRGGDSSPWVFYAYETHGESRSGDEVLNCFDVYLDGASGAVHARVSLLGVFDLAVVLGCAEVGGSRQLRYEMNALALCRPDDVREARIAGPVPGLPVPTAPEVWTRAVRDRIAALDARRQAAVWRADGPDLLQRVNAAGRVPEGLRWDALVAALDGQQQRLLNLASIGTDQLSRRLRESDADAKDVAEVLFGLRTLLEADATSECGVTQLTEAHADRLVEIIATELAVLFAAERPIADEDLRDLLEGASGIHAVMRHSLELLRPHLGALQ